MASNAFGALMASNTTAKVHPAAAFGGGSAPRGGIATADAPSGAKDAEADVMGHEWGDRLLPTPKVTLMPGAKELAVGAPPPGLF
jgi:hypothetical protein